MIKEGKRMNRIVTMVLKNIWQVPGLWFQLCHYAKHTDEYPELEKWQHIQRILKLAIKGGNIDLQVTGLENIPMDEPFMMYANHQGMFDVLAVVVSCDRPMGVVFKKEIENFKNDGYTKLTIDLRNNSGGSLKLAVDLSTCSWLTTFFF